jgi:hypothetical protein
VGVGVGVGGVQGGLRKWVGAASKRARAPRPAGRPGVVFIGIVLNTHIAWPNWPHPSRRGEGGRQREAERGGEEEGEGGYSEGGREGGEGEGERVTRSCGLGFRVPRAVLLV